MTFVLQKIGLRRVGVAPRNGEARPEDIREFAEHKAEQQRGNELMKLIFGPQMPSHSLQSCPVAGRKGWRVWLLGGNASNLAGNTPYRGGEVTDQS